MSGLTSLAGFLGIVTIGTGLVLHDRISDPQWLAILAVAWLFLLAGSRISLPDRLPPFNRSLIRTALMHRPDPEVPKCAFHSAYFSGVPPVLRQTV